MKQSLKHEVRTPLNHILGYSEMLQEEASDRALPAWAEAVHRIHAAGTRLLALSEEILADGLHPAIRPEWDSLLASILDTVRAAPTEPVDPFVADLERIRTAVQRLQGLPLPSHPVPTDVAGPAPSAPLAAEPAEEGLAQEAPAAPDGLPGARVLVVDDDEGNRMMLCRRLERLGYRTEMAEDGRAALDRLARQSFDLVLLDIHMPVLDGYEVLRRRRDDPRLLAVPIIVLSASDDIAHAVRSIGLGAEDYLPKPFSSVLLRARISACIERKQLRDREAAHLVQIETERARSEALLRVILPPAIVEELKSTRRVQPRRYDRVGVLFCDIAGFTAWCDGKEPELVHHELQALVETFEEIAARHGLEKIKTIGDSFMAVSGLLTKATDPGSRCVGCGLEMIQAAAALPPQWRLRVGVDVGSVIAGVVGRSKYQFDVWGDAVNTASRLEQTAIPGSVCVGSTVWNTLGPRAHGASMGSLTLKGKGAMELYRVDRIEATPAPRSAAGES